MDDGNLRSWFLHLSGYKQRLQSQTHDWADTSEHNPVDVLLSSAAFQMCSMFSNATALLSSRHVRRSPAKFASSPPSPSCCSCRPRNNSATTQQTVMRSEKLVWWVMEQTPEQKDQKGFYETNVALHVCSSQGSGNLLSMTEPGPSTPAPTGRCTRS